MLPECLGQFGGWDGAGQCRREFDAEREALHQTADLEHFTLVRLERECGADPFGALHEQFHGILGGAGRRNGLGCGHRQTLEPQQPFRRKPQRFTRGRQHLQFWTGAQQLLELNGVGDQVLKVVQHQQQVTGLQPLEQLRIGINVGSGHHLKHP